MLPHIRYFEYRDEDSPKNARFRVAHRPEEFLKANFKLSAVGSVFRTVKAKFPPATIHAEAAKAGWSVQITDEGPWLRVQIVGKAPKTKSDW